MAETEAVEQPTAEEIDDSSPKALVQSYVREFTRYDTEFDNWKQQRKRIVKRYRNERGPREKSASRFNILWSIVQTTKPALFSRNPKPDIQRRFKDADPIGRVASDIMERCASFYCQTDEFKHRIELVVTDYLLPGRGTVWFRYVPHFKAADDIEITDDERGPDDADEGIDEPAETIEREEVVLDYVHCEDFGHNIARTWDEVWLGWRIAYMDKAALEKRFPEKADKIPLDYTERKSDDKSTGAIIKKASVYEAWDKKRAKAIWIHKEVEEPLDERDDPLKLDGFFPFPRPLFTNLANDSLVPVPDYVQYQDQAKELDVLTARIAAIQRALKVAGIYDASAAGIGRLLAEGTENELIPVDKWAAMAEKGGLQGAFALLPMDQIAAILTQLYEAREQIKAVIYEETGIADIVRGQSDPNETAAAQGIKSNFATLRLSHRQDEVQTFIRNCIVIMTNIICNHFQPESIKDICGIRLFTQEEKQAYLQAQQPPQPGMPPQQPPPMPQGVSQDQFQQMMQNPTWEEVLALIKDEPMRKFRIDIETDSIIKVDEEADKQSRMEFLKASGEFLQQASQIGEGNPALLPLVGQMLLFGVRAFPVGKELESTFESTLQKLEQMAQNPQQKPDPAMAKVQAESQIKQQQMQQDSQIEQMKLQAQQQTDHAKMQGEMELERFKAQAQAQVDQHQNQLEFERRQAELASEERLQTMKLNMEQQTEVQVAHIRAAAQIEAARVAAKASTGDEAEAREAGGE